MASNKRAMVIEMTTLAGFIRLQALLLPRARVKAICSRKFQFPCSTLYVENLILMAGSNSSVTPR